MNVKGTMEAVNRDVKTQLAHMNVIVKSAADKDLFSKAPNVLVSFS